MTSSSRTMTRRLFAAAAVAVVAATASACSGGGIDAGAAAIVDGRRISVDDVQTATRQVNEIIDPYGQNPDQRLTQRDALGYLIQLPFVTAAASANGVGVSEQEAETIFRQAAQTRKEQLATGQVKLLDPETGTTPPTTASLQVVQSILARNKLNPSQDGTGRTQEEAITIYQGISAQMQKASIRVNPRYGTFTAAFDPQDIFRVKAATPGWLVAEPAPEPTPSPAAS